MSNVDAIIKSLREHPEEWECDQYKLAHKSGQAIWILFGMLLAGNYEQPFHSSIPMSFGLFGRVRLWLAFRKWREWAVERALIGETL